jgi:hypothetical protein
MTRTDQNVETARYQKDIATRLGLDPQNLIFNYKQKNETVRLDLVTVNPKHDQSFLFHTVTGTDKIDALKKMLDYIESHYHNESSLTHRICMKPWISFTTAATLASIKYSALPLTRYRKTPKSPKGDFEIQ